MAIPQSEPDRCLLSWAAKIVASGVFVTGRDAADVFAQSATWVSGPSELLQAARAARSPAPLLEGVTIDVDETTRQVRVARGGVEGFAGFDGALGAIVLDDESAPRRAFTPLIAPRPSPLPESGSGADRAHIAAALDLLFADPRQMTIACIVLHKGSVVGERYLAPFDAETRFESWSMGKSLGAALIGRAAALGLIDLDASLDFPEWSVPKDARSAITMRQLLTMSSGLAFSGSFDLHEDNTRKTENGLLHDHTYVYASGTNAAAFCLDKMLENPPGAHGRYRNCDPILAMHALRAALSRNGDADFRSWPFRALLNQIGADGILLEEDPAGLFLISGHVYGRARDWARLAQLYLQRGLWNGERLLEEAFIDFSQSPSSAHARGDYGAFMRLNRNRILRALPEDSYFMNGGGGQRAIIVPSLDLVIVRMGHVGGLQYGQLETQAQADSEIVNALAG